MGQSGKKASGLAHQKRDRGSHGTLGHMQTRITYSRRKGIQKQFAPQCYHWSIEQMEKPRLRDIYGLIQGHTAERTKLERLEVGNKKLAWDYLQHYLTLQPIL